MPTPLEKKTKRQFDLYREVVPMEASNLNKNILSVTLGLFHQNEEYRLQISQMTVRPIARNFALSTKELSLQEQYLLKYRGAIDALNHNVRFVMLANKFGEPVPLKNKETQKHAEVFIDFPFLLQDSKFEHNSRTLVNNTRHNELTTVYDVEDFNQKAIYVLKTSKTIISNLKKLVSKDLFTEEDKTLEEMTLKRADLIINSLKSKKISLDKFQAELKNQRKSVVATK